MGDNLRVLRVLAEKVASFVKSSGLLVSGRR